MYFYAYKMKKHYLIMIKKQEIKLHKKFQKRIAICREKTIQQII